MSNFVALCPDAHKACRVNTSKIEAQGANERLVPVVISEFSKLVVQYPIVFTKSDETGEFRCVAMLGFERDENLYWEGGQWSGIYTPLNILRQPFFVAKEAGAPVLCIDETSVALSQEEGALLFNQDSSETTFLNDVKKMLGDLLAAEQKTREFINTLIDFDLILPMPLNITFGNGQKHSVRGLYTVDEEKLSNLEPDKLVRLQTEGYLAPLYNMIASTGHIFSLVDKKNTRNARAN